MSRFIGASIGPAVHLEHGESSAELLLRAADAAMYHAKRAREGVRVYDAGTAAGANASWLAAELLIAIENDEIELAYQPQCALPTGQVVGVEALARWHRAGGPDVPPSEFVPLAEQTGLIRALTHLTLRKALEQARGWHDVGVHVPVSVNLSASMLADRSLQAVVGGLLADRGLDASFKALHELPLDGVKIDRDLVNDFGSGGQSLLAATIDIGRRLGLKVVAEGIEDETGLELVRRLGVDSAQGYHLARPMSSDALWTLLSRHAPDTTHVSNEPDGQGSRT